MPNTTRVDHDRLDSIMQRAEKIRSKARDDNDSFVLDNVDPAIHKAIEEGRKDDRARNEEDADAHAEGKRANREVEEIGDDAGRSLDSVDGDLTDDKSGPTGRHRAPEGHAGEGDTHLTAAEPAGDNAAADAAQRHAEQSAAQQAAAQQQAQQEAAHQAAQQQAAQQAAQQQAQSQAMRQAEMSAQQQAAWQQAVQQENMRVNQLNQQAQMQAMQQVGTSTPSDSVSVEEIQQIIDDFYADESNHVSGGDGSASISGERLDAAGTDDLGGAENVSLEKTASGPLSDEETDMVINQALDLNGISDDPAVREAFTNVWRHMSINESGNDPGAANGWDSNAVGATASDGFPAQSSRGQWQCIPDTFSTYHVGGTSNSIYDPLASAAASVNYAMQNYGIGADGSGLAEFAASRGVDPSSGSTTGGYLGY